jgi:citrate lyase subunit beta / citryl-CoA lyase
MPAVRLVEKGRVMKLRSILFVPGDRPDRMAKAAATQADALILDLEDSVALSQKANARAAVAAFFAEPRTKPLFVRVNPLDSGMIDFDLAAVLPAKPDAIVLPKAEGAASVLTLAAKMMSAGVTAPILPIATETPLAVFKLGEYVEVAQHIMGLSWGAEDLPAAIGATASRDAHGHFLPPYEMVRAMTLFAAHAAGVTAIETVNPDFQNADGFAAYCQRARRDGFTGMLAIHPQQIDIINAAFSPSVDEITHAQAIVDAFAQNPDAGALSLNGKMIDRPHLKQAQRILAKI